VDTEKYLAGIRVKRKNEHQLRAKGDIIFLRELDSRWNGRGLPAYETLLKKGKAFGSKAEKQKTLKNFSGLRSKLVVTSIKTLPLQLERSRDL